MYFLFKLVVVFLSTFVYIVYTLTTTSHQHIHNGKVKIYAEFYQNTCKK